MKTSKLLHKIEKYKVVFVMLSKLNTLEPFYQELGILVVL